MSRATGGHRPLTEANARAYVAGGGSQCPYCGDADIAGGRVAVEADTAWQEVACAACGASWNDVFLLAGVDVLDAQGDVLATLDGTGPAPIAEVLTAGAVASPPSSSPPRRPPRSSIP